VGLIALVAVVGLAYVAYDQFLRGDEVARLSLGSPAPSASAAAVATPKPTSSATGGGTAVASPIGSMSATQLAGTWTVGTGSVAGYRVREQLANLPAQSDAVGRTDSITGEATIVASGEAVEVTEGRFEADLSRLASDNGRRDRRLQESGIETNRFPTATFVLSSPVIVPAEALGGATVDVTLAGDLTLHGATKPVEIPAKARLADGRIEVVGSLAFALADFAIDPPNIAGFVSVENSGTLEFLLALEKG
jgi:polyisoprenoid-binding protein YceI